MKKHGRIIELTTLLLCLIVLSASNLQAQVCGGGFFRFEVSDAEGHSVPDVTIEIVAQLSAEEFTELLKGQPALQRYNKISDQEAGDVIKRGRPMQFVEDFCENPLRQRANSTRVKKEWNGEPDIMNFGFCALETYGKPLLLRITAPGYRSDYYLGPFLGGCGGKLEFVLAKESAAFEN
jgi:hypothetical protein